MFQGVHDTICYGPCETGWKAGEPKINQIVFIGRKLDRKALMEGFRWAGGAPAPPPPPPPPPPPGSLPACSRQAPSATGAGIQSAGSVAAAGREVVGAAGALACVL